MNTRGLYKIPSLETRNLVISYSCQVTISHPCHMSSHLTSPSVACCCRWHLLQQPSCSICPIFLWLTHSQSSHLRSSHKKQRFVTETSRRAQKRRTAQHTNNPSLLFKYGTWRARCKSWNGITDRQLTPLFKSPLGSETGERKEYRRALLNLVAEEGDLVR